MKIVCQSCSATYKIADDKIQGKKVFKIKCKKCGEDILVRGTDAPAEPVASPMAQHGDDDHTRAMAQEGGEAVWHAVLNGDQQGPYTIDQLRELMAQGAIDTETYVWRDGFEGWLPMRDVPELSMLTVALPESSTVMSAPPGADLFGAGSSPAPAPAASSYDNRSSRSAEPAKARTAPKGGDLFAPEAREQEAAKPLFAAEEPKAAPAGEQLTGQRNENSVLFSLATLQQLSGKETPKSSAGINPDSSGMIDINKLAGALNTGGGGKKSSVDDIMSVGATAGGFSSPLAAPVLAPVAVPVAPMSGTTEHAKPQGVNKTIVVTGVAVAAILVGGIVTATLMLNRNNNNNRGDGDGTNVAANTPPPSAAPAPLAAPAPAPVAAPVAAPAAPPAAVPEATAHEHEHEHEHHDHERPSTGSAASAPAAPAPAAAAHPAAPSAAPRPASTGTRSIDDLLNAVGTPHPAAAANTPSSSASSAPSGGGGTPETPDRATVGAALRGLSSSVRACGTGQGGTAMVTIVFANTGRVTTANVNGIPPGPAVSCIVTAVRHATLPAFSRPTFSVTYPYPLN